MLDIDTAIKHCLEVAEKNETLSEWGERNKVSCLECAADHRQLAEWLTELKNRREVSEIERRAIEKCDKCLDIFDCPLYYPWLKG